ncbi:Kiwa anti-phage protein KwaB-like domain-containing protein [Halorubrum laminariae]|uniref:Kiwa anti-phage protein KwaB-like domain-containing protein n=1 Tax=Halorubrum laminariae TaxID=1433523 RepID=A0ABD6BZA8_9EURY|nr:Kiwa anti-phage protein KwaB-like domain-containing protein [Halorubrum laminariae]
MTDISDLEDARTFGMGHGSTRDIVVAREQNSNDGLEFEFGEVPINQRIANDIQDLVKSRLKKRIENYRDGKTEFEEYDLSNINRDPQPIQYCDRDDFPMSDSIEELFTENDLPESSYEEPRPDFQAIRLKNSDGKMLVAFRGYTNRQVIEMNRKGWMMLQDQEYNKVNDGELVSLPQKIDAIYFDGQFFIFKQRSFEDTFDWVEELENTAVETFRTIKDSNVLIHNMSEFRERVYNHRTKMRKLYEVSQSGITSDLDMQQAKAIIDEFGLELDIRENGDGKEGIEIPDGHRVWDVIRLFNNDHLVSPVDSSRFQVYGKEQR